MPKKKEIESVLHDWVHGLPFQMQALLLTAIRGADGSSKHNHAKIIIRYLRGCVLKPAGEWSGKNDNDFMWGEFTSKHITEASNGIAERVQDIQTFKYYSEQFWRDHDQYPHHFIMHLVHCAQVLAYYYPFELMKDIREHWRLFYLQACESFHMNPETKDQMDDRLNDFGYGYGKNTSNE